MGSFALFLATLMHVPCFAFSIAAQYRLFPCGGPSLPWLNGPPCAAFAFNEMVCNARQDVTLGHDDRCPAVFVAWPSFALCASSWCFAGGDPAFGCGPPAVPPAAGWPDSEESSGCMRSAAVHRRSGRPEENIARRKGLRLKKHCAAKGVKGKTGGAMSYDRDKNKTTRTGLVEQVPREHPEEVHDQHLDDDNDGRGHADERHGPAVQLRKWKDVLPSTKLRRERLWHYPGCGSPHSPHSLSPVASQPTPRRPIHPM